MAVWGLVSLKLLALSLLSISSLCHASDQAVPVLSMDRAVDSHSVGGSSCISGYVKVPFNVTGSKITLAAPQTREEVTNFMVELVQVNSTLPARVIQGSVPIVGAYDIFARLCFPKYIDRSKVKTVQFLTHGATLDSTYWDIIPGLSYVDAATAAGYATFAWDQLGTGRSAHPDPINVVQSTVQLEIAHILVQALRRGDFGDCRLRNVVGVGHSAGSFIVQGQAAKYPQDYNALILTGLSTNFNSVNIATAGFDFINARDDPNPNLKKLPAGYITQQSEVGVQFGFYRWNNYNTAAFNEQYKNKATNTPSTLLTLGSIAVPASRFTGPIDVVLGENDNVFCGGNCNTPANQAALVQPVFFPAAAPAPKSQNFIAPGSGHSINAHNSAPLAFAHQIQFLKFNGL